MMNYKRGDIVAINLNPTKGHEVGKIRPCVVISDSDSNELLDTIIIMPLSTQLIENMHPFRVRLRQRDALKYDSDVLINHIRTISKKRVGNIISKISEEEYKTITQALCANF